MSTVFGKRGKEETSFDFMSDKRKPLDDDIELVNLVQQFKVHHACSAHIIDKLMELVLGRMGYSHEREFLSPLSPIMKHLQYGKCSEQLLRVFESLNELLIEKISPSFSLTKLVDHSTETTKKANSADSSPKLQKPKQVGQLTIVLPNNATEQVSGTLHE